MIKDRILEKKNFVFIIVLIVSLAALPSLAQKKKGKSKESVAVSSTGVTDESIRKYMADLANDDAKGRGSATEDELRAGKYIAAQLKGFGIEAAGDNGDYIQDVPFVRRSRTAAPSAVQPMMHTRNVVAIMRGSDPELSKQAILLTAHMDHLGVRTPVNGDSIYNGADDDASGVIAVLELAKVLSHEKKPKRTVVFALFGSEEIGGYGARFFLEHPPVPLTSIVANLEFEMIGRPDSAVAAHTLWLTGYDKSNLGKELAAHGARLVADPHPDQNFFRRSDNYALALKGVVAHTVSSYGLHKQYHQPDDDIAHIDFAHMTESIQSMVVPVEWLANSDFVPKWNEGMRP